MDQILVPEFALKSESAFREWSIETCAFLFSAKARRAMANVYIMKESTIKEKFKIISKYVTLVFGISENELDLNPPTNKMTSVTVDVVTIACEVIMSHHNVGCSQMGRALDKNHSTILYYRRRHRNHLVMKDYKANYLRLLNLLYNEGIIQPIEKSESNSQRVLHSVLH